MKHRDHLGNISMWRVLVISSVFAEVGIGTQSLAFHPPIQPPTRHHFVLYLVTQATFPSFKNKSLFFFFALLVDILSFFFPY